MRNRAIRLENDPTFDASSRGQRCSQLMEQLKIQYDLLKEDRARFDTSNERWMRMSTVVFALISAAGSLANNGEAKLVTFKLSPNLIPFACGIGFLMCVVWLFRSYVYMKNIDARHETINKMERHSMPIVPHRYVWSIIRRNSGWIYDLGTQMAYAKPIIAGIAFVVLPFLLRAV